MSRPLIFTIAAIILALLIAGCVQPVISPTPAMATPEPTQETAVQEEAQVVEPPPMDDPSLLPIERFQMFVDDLPVDVDVFREGWGKTYAAGVALDPAMPPSNHGFPPFVFVDFTSPLDEVFPDPKAIFTMDVAQGRIFPVAPYLAMYEEAGRDYAQNAVTGLQQILAERPAALDDTLLTLPGFGDAQQGVRGSPTYIDFEGGSGVGFVAGYGQEIGPLLNDTLVYQFVGLNDDGTQYISFAFPLEANFLHDLDSVTEEEIAAAEADLESYLAGVTEQIANAADSDFTPDLAALNAAMQTIVIGPSTEDTEETSDALSDEQADGDDEFPVIGISDKPVGTITTIACPVHPSGDEVEGETYYCGTYTVPLNYDDPEGNTLDMTFMVAKSTGDNPLPDPLVQLVGGPGQSGLIVGGLTSTYEPVRENRDIVLTSVRGTKFSQRFGVEQCFGTALAQGMSEEQLEDLVESISPTDEGSADAERAFDDALAERQAAATKMNALCQEVFNNAGLDVKQFTTTNTATDIVGLIDALGYDTYNLHGTSYGTRLALVIMRDHAGSGLRSVVLDSTAPRDARTNSLIRDVRRPHDQVRRLFADCAEDPSCAEAYPDLEQRFIALLASLEAEALQIEGRTIGVEDVVAVISDLTATRPNYMPLMIEELEQGVADTFLGLQTQRLGMEMPEPQEATIDPALQSLFAGMLDALADQGDEDTDVFGFLAVDVAAAASQDDPRAGITQLIQDKFEGDARRDLLAQLNDIADESLAELKAGLETMAAEDAEGDEDQAAYLALRAQGDSLLLRHVIDCREVVPFESLDDALAEYGRLEIPRLGGPKSELIQTVAGCAGWDLADVDPIDNEPIISDVPALILQGEFDTATPMAWGQLAAESLGNSTLVIVPLQGHEVWIKASPCVSAIANAFIADPSQAPGLSCLEERKAQFVLPAE